MKLRSSHLVALVSAVALLVGLVPLLDAVSTTPAAAATGDLALPDLVSVIPANMMEITHPTPTTKEFEYEHTVFNAGSGPLDIVPTYNVATATATGVQRLFSYDANGTSSVAQQVPVHDQFIWHQAHGHFHFPLASFGLYGTNADGSLGAPVAVSPKNGFCIGDSVRADPATPHSPSGIFYSGDTCTDPTALRGIDPGWGDLYDRRDPGQAIDITGVPDGIYWFHAVADPDNNFIEADKTNNTTDIKLQISGDTVHAVSPLMSQGSFVIDKSFLDSGQGATDTPPFSTAAPGELLVALIAAQGGSAPQTQTVTGGGLNWTLATRTNTQAGTSEVWTARAATTLSNVVVSANVSTPGFTQSMTVLAVQGAAGIGATGGSSGATGAPNVALNTTANGSWVIGVGNDPDHYTPRVVPAGQTMVQEGVNEEHDNDTWVQATTAPTPNAGTAVTINDLAPIAHRWNMASIELLAASSTDHTAPVISGGAAGAVGPDRATVSWSTNEPSTSRIAYGTTTALGSTTALDPTLVTSHSQTIAGLVPDTDYFCELRSVDSAGNQGTSTAVSFRTTPPCTAPPVFSNVHINDLQPDQATMAWLTDEQSTSQVEYGTTTSYGSVSTVDPNLVAAHFLVVTGLQPSTTYHYRVKGTDPYGNAGASTDNTFTTPALPPPIGVDATVFKDGAGTQTTASFNTAKPNELLVAYVSSDGPASAAQAATVSGGGLTWSLVTRANTQGGDAEVWRAIAPATPVNLTVTSTPTIGGLDQSLTVVAYNGAVGVGASKTGNGTGSTPSLTFNMTRSGSLVYAVGNDWSSAAGRTPGTGQSIVHQFNDAGIGDSFWTQRLNNPAGPVESVVTTNITAPTTVTWNMAAVEIVRPVSVPATAPTVSSVASSNVTTTGATISWLTDQPSSSQVSYGTTSAYGSSTTLDPTAVTSHSQSLAGLTPNTTYHYSVRSANSIGGTSSADATFTTASTNPPPANQSISFGVVGSRSLAQSPFTVAATATSGLAVTFTTTTPAVCTAGGTNGTTITLVATGTCSIVANQAGNAAFNPAPPVTQSLTVTTTTPAGIAVDKTISKDGTSTQTTGPLTTTQPGELLVAFVSADGPLGSTQTATVTGAGLTWTLVKRANAQAGTAEIWQATAPTTLTNATITATPAQLGYDQSVTVVAFTGATGIGATANASAATGAPTVALTTTAAGSLVYANGNDWDGATARTPVTGQTITHQFLDTTGGDTFWTQGTTNPVPATATTITAGATAPNNHRYNLTAIEIKAGSTTTPPPPVNQTIAFGAIANRALNQSPFTASATASSGLAVTFTTTTPAVCTAGGTNGTTITLVATGTCSIVANQAGNAAFNAAPPVTQSFTVARSNQSISFGVVGSRSLAQSPFTVAATATSGLAVTFTTTTPAVCTAGGTNGTTITLVATGTCSIVANQAGNAAFNPAPPVTQSLTVTTTTPAGIAVDKTISKDGTSTQTTGPLTTTQPGELLVAFVSADGPLGSTQTATVTGAGLTWTLVKRANAQAGTAEIWQATAPTTLTNATITATPAQLGYDQSVTVVAFTGATGIGATANASAATGAPTVALTTTAAGSLVYANGNDWDGATARTPVTGQTITHQFLDTTGGDTFWTQGTTNPVPATATTITAGATAPNNHRYNLTAIEIKGA